MPSTPGNGCCDQSRTSVGLACRSWPRKNEALGIYSRDAAVSRLTVDRVDFGIRQQYRAVWTFIISRSRQLAESLRITPQESRVNRPAFSLRRTLNDDQGAAHSHRSAISGSTFVARRAGK